MTAQPSPLARKLGAYAALSDQEITALNKMHDRRRSYSAGRDIVLRGEKHQAAYILASGGVLLQAAVGWNATDCRLPDPR